MEIILASASPRRRELMKYISTSFTVIPSAVEEIVPEEIDPKGAPEYLALLKARDIAKKYPNALVIGADTAVFIDGQMLGKPRDAAQAKEMLSSLSGRSHRVITGCAFCYQETEKSFSEITEVHFFPLSDEEIEAYIATGEPFDKAGGYGIQSKGVLFVEKIDGDYSNVVGFPVARLARLLKSVCPDFDNLK